MKTYLWAAAAVLAAAMVTWGAHRGARPTKAGGAAGAPDDEAATPLAEAAYRPRSLAKRRVVEALLAGEYTLLEAAARFRELDVQEPRLPWHYPEGYAGDDEAEGYCRAVMTWTDNHVRSCTRGDHSAEAEAVGRRLEDELEGHRLCGTLALPGVPGDDGRAPCLPSP